jgi:LmbE family N-acetylglucosaminyl deacetylase
VVCPWTLGGHVDHRLTRLAAERLVRDGRAPGLWFYGDYPYILQDASARGQIGQAGYRERVFPVSEAGLAAWQDSVAAHATQISTFWPDLGAMRAALRAFCEAAGGVCLWRAAGS